MASAARRAGGRGTDARRGARRAAHRLHQLAPAMTDSRKLTMLRESHVILDDYITAGGSVDGRRGDLCSRARLEGGDLRPPACVSRSQRQPGSGSQACAPAGQRKGAGGRLGAVAEQRGLGGRVLRCARGSGTGRERLEADLATVAQSRRTVVTPSEIQQRLAPGEVLIDLVDFSETRWTEGPGRRVFREPKLLAFVVRPRVRSGLWTWVTRSDRGRRRPLADGDWGGCVRWSQRRRRSGRRSRSRGLRARAKAART